MSDLKVNDFVEVYIRGFISHYFKVTIINYENLDAVLFITYNSNYNILMRKYSIDSRHWLRIIRIYDNKIDLDTHIAPIDYDRLIHPEV